MCPNVAYVYVETGSHVTHRRWATAGLSVVKSILSACIPYLARESVHCGRLNVKSTRLFITTSRTIRWRSLVIFVLTAFHSIFTPLLATVLVEPRCLRYAWDKPPVESLIVDQTVCAHMSDSDVCTMNRSKTFSISYEVRAQMSHICAYAITTVYAPVLIGYIAVVSIMQPLCMYIAAKWLSAHRQSEQKRNASRIRPPVPFHLLPKLLREDSILAQFAANTCIAGRHDE